MLRFSKRRVRLPSSEPQVRFAPAPTDQRRSPRSRLAEACRACSALGVLATSLCFLTVASVVAQTDEVPLDLQAALFGKILRYVKTLEKPDQVVVLIVYDSERDRRVRQVAQAFAEAGVGSLPVEAGALREAINGQSVLYLLPSAVTPEVESICEEHHLLSISGNPATVENGDAAVGVRISEGRSQIIVNTQRLNREGHRISADLLKMARLVE